MKHVYLSPHLDDAVWSAGGAIAACVARGDDVRVVTVCAGVPSAALALPEPVAAAYAAAGLTPAAVVEMRRNEDRKAVAGLGAGAEWMDELDAIYRFPEAYSTFERLLGEPLEGDPLGGAVDERLSREPAVTLVHAPLAVGGHVDHRLVCAAARRRGGAVFYEDLPYVIDFPGALERRLAEFGGDLVPFLFDVTGTLERRLQAVRAYASQLAPRRDDLPSRLADYARGLGGGRPMERVWAPRGFAPPAGSGYAG